MNSIAHAAAYGGGPLAMERNIPGRPYYANARTELERTLASGTAAAPSPAKKAAQSPATGLAVLGIGATIAFGLLSLL